uniref:Uncharacterized protein n=1 Tax=Pyrodinium bahamense TaxID=73915 RepID=A0A7S0FXU7_9DINO
MVLLFAHGPGSISMVIDAAVVAAMLVIAAMFRVARWGGASAQKGNASCGGSCFQPVFLDPPPATGFRGAPAGVAAALLEAAVEGDAAACGRALEAQPAWLEACNAEGQTALALAARAGHVAACEVLLAAHADVEAVDATQKTPLSHAVQQKHYDVCRLLLEHGADVEAADCVVRDAGCLLL